MLLVFATLGINLPFGALWQYLLGGPLVMVVFIFVARGVEGAEIAVSLVALAVICTLLLQATTAGYVALWLGLIEEPQPGAPG
jgi:NhaP-type Na+/H+ or K+/H+ antiporter